MATKTNKLKSFQIDFKRWGKASLRNPYDGDMCCLGFCAKSLGYSDDAIYDRATPACLLKDFNSNLHKKWPKWMLDGEDTITSSINQIVEANDNCDMPDSLRMAKITKVFNRHHIKVRWINVPKTVRKNFNDLMNSRSKYRRLLSASLEVWGDIIIAEMG